MASLTSEMQAVRDNDFRLRFRVPTAEELGKIRRIHRDMSKAEIEEVERIQTALTAFSQKLKTGEIAKEHLSKDLIRDLSALLKSDDGE
jgi:superfamily I DNA and RNA helicase